MSGATQSPGAPPDRKARERALVTDKSFIVQAPAGSGKTELLVRRYLALLATVEAPEQILAITFTRKATAEMRQRIIHALDGTAAPADDQAAKLIEAACANDAQREWHLTANTRRLRIQTIDAFCNELVWRMPWSARFGAPPGLADDPAPLHQQAAKRALDHLERNDQWSDAADALLALVDAHWGRARDLLAAMLANRDQWMRALAAGDWGPDDRGHFERMWQDDIDRELRAALAAASKPGAAGAAWAEMGAYAAANLLAAGADSPVTALRGMTEWPAASHEHIAQWHGLAALALKKDGGARKTVTKRDGFPVGDDHQRAQKKRILALLESARDSSIAEALEAVRALPRGRFDDAQWHSVNAVVQLLRVAAAELKLLFKERNQADYIELTQRAALALGDAEAPSDLALAFDYQLDHVLMDEFQDTSSAHLELLEKLTAGWQAGDGRTLFLVGDPMQSIYRFREAEVGNFLSVEEQKQLGGVGLESLRLEANFRSVPQLVDWFNATFAEALPARNDAATGAVCYAPATACAKPAAGGARVHAAVNGQAQAEAEAIADLIAAAQKEDADQRIAVLGRTRRHLAATAAALRRRGIAFCGRDLEKLGERPAVRDLIALTRALAQPADRVAMLSVLRAPWCGLGLGDLSALAATSAVEHTATLPELWRDDQRLAALSADGRARLARFTLHLDAALRRRGRVSLRHNVESAWLALGGPATMCADALDDCSRYLDLLGGMEAAQAEITAAGLRQAAGELWAQGGADAKVELLTIHKAKGLEFDIVLVPRLDARPRAPHQPLLRWRKLPGRLLLAPLPASGAAERGDGADPFYRYLARLERQHEHYETGRLLYVACTRARRQLHLFGQARLKDGAPQAPPAGSLLALLWPSVAAQFEQAAGEFDGDSGDLGAPGDAGEFQPPPLSRLPLDWRPPPLPVAPGDAAAEAPAGGAPERLEFSWAGETARITGIVIHQILQGIDTAGWEQWRRQANDEARWRNQLLENGLAERHLQAALEQIAAAIDNARNDPRAAWIFSAGHRDIRTEWPLTGVAGGRIEQVVIDRSFIDEHGARWVIDFKSSRHEGGDVEAFLDRERERHAPQMALYAQVVGALPAEGAKEVKLGLYFPALRGWRQWAGGAAVA